MFGLTYSVLDLIIAICGVLFGYLYTPLQNKATVIPAKYKFATIYHEPCGGIGIGFFIVSLVISTAIFVFYTISGIISEYSEGYNFIGQIFEVWPKNNMEAYWKYIAAMLGCAISLALDSVFMGLLLKLSLQYFGTQRIYLKFIYHIPSILWIRVGIEVLNGLCSVLLIGIAEDVFGSDAEWETPEISMIYFSTWIIYFLSLKSHYKQFPGIPESQPTADETRLAELRTELQKIPVQKVKQWYAEGKLTEEQYRIVAKKYSAIRKEMAEIQERLDRMYNILPEGQNNGT